MVDKKHKTDISTRTGERKQNENVRNSELSHFSDVSAAASNEIHSSVYHLVFFTLI